jgi:hypothetical protein
MSRYGPSGLTQVPAKQGLTSKNGLNGELRPFGTSVGWVLRRWGGDQPEVDLLEVQLRKKLAKIRRGASGLASRTRSG